MHSSCRPRRNHVCKLLSCNFQRLRFYRGLNFPFSYWFFHGPYNSAALLRCLWWWFNYRGILRTCMVRVKYSLQIAVIYQQRNVTVILHHCYQVGMTCSAVSTQFTNVTGGRTVRKADVSYSHTMIYKYWAIIITITSLPKVIWEESRVAAAVPGAGWHKGLRIRNVCIVLVKDRCANVRYFSVRKQE